MWKKEVNWMQNARIGDKNVRNKPMEMWLFERD